MSSTPGGLCALTDARGSPLSCEELGALLALYRRTGRNPTMQTGGFHTAPPQLGIGSLGEGLLQPRHARTAHSFPFSPLPSVCPPAQAWDTPCPEVTGELSGKYRGTRAAGPLEAAQLAGEGGRELRPNSCTCAPARLPGCPFKSPPSLPHVSALFDFLHSLSPLK